MANNTKDKEIAVRLTDIIYIFRSIDTANSELEAAVADGLIKEDVLIDMQEAARIISEYMNVR